MVQNLSSIHILLLIIVVIAIVGALLFITRRKPKAVTAEKNQQSNQAPQANGEKADDSTKLKLSEGQIFNKALFSDLDKHIYALAFNNNPNDKEIPPPHDQLVKSIVAGFSNSVLNKEYLPRKPLVIPQLLKAIRSDGSTKQKLVEIIVQDPVLAADVLRISNSPFFRLSSDPIETVGEAVVILGTDGLRSVVSTSVMQPVFNVPKKYFPTFSETIWNKAVLTAVTAQVFARKTKSCDSFTAHLLGLMSSIGQIFVFRVTVARYDKQPELQPLASVFTLILEKLALKASGEVISNWDFGGQIITALEDFYLQRNPEKMSALGKALYFASLCGTLAILAQKSTLDETQALSYLQQEGLGKEVSLAMWETVNKSIEEEN